jgi:hypothetical protein
VYFVEEHNFHVEWHLRFGVEIREKASSTPRVTIHRCPENNNLGMQFVQFVKTTTLRPLLKL